MRKNFSSLRFQIPALTIIMVVGILVIAYLVTKNTAETDTITSEKQRVYDRLNFIQNGAEQLLRAGQDESLQQLISSFSSEPDVRKLLIVDRDNLVLASLQYADLGKPWNQISHNISQAWIEQTVATNRSAIYVDENLQYLNGLTSVCDFSVTSRLRPSTCGFLYYQLDLGAHLDSLAGTLSNQVMIIAGGVVLTALLIMSFLHNLVTRRTTMIANAVEEFENGNTNTQAVVPGKDEIAQLARRLNQMFYTINQSRRIIEDREKRLSSILSTANEPIITINSHGRVESFNTAAEQVFGYKREEIIGKNIKLLMPEKYSLHHDSYISNYLNTGIEKIIGQSREVEAMRKDGSTFPAEISISRYEVDQKTFFTGIIRDVSEHKALQDALLDANKKLRESNAQLSDYALLDGLTGLANRRQFDHILEDEIQRAYRHNTPLLLLLSDIDYFKNYNDTFGHQQGDAVLEKVGQLFRHVFQRSSDLPARYGGEEFAVILPGLNRDEGLAIAQKLQQTLARQAIPHSASQVADHITLSIGLASLNLEPAGRPEHAADLVQHADEALYQAKSDGRNCIRVYPCPAR